MNDKCLECTKAGHTPVRLTRLPLAEGIAIFVLSSRAGVSPEIHVAVSEFLEKIGKELSETLLNEECAKRALEPMQMVH
jgi:hypothetical protein